MFGIEHTEFNICPNLQAPCPLLLAQGAVVLNLGGISVPTSPLQNQWLAELTVHAQNNILPHLERISCECYSVIKIEVDLLLHLIFLHGTEKPRISSSTHHAVLPG